MVCTTKSLSGSWRTFMEPSAPQEKSLDPESMCSCVTPWPMFLKKLERACSPGNMKYGCSVDMLQTYKNKNRPFKICPKLKRDENIWQPIILNLNNQAEFKDTLMSPSAEPVTKNSSLGSSARHLTADSCPWNLCRSCRCLTSKMQMSPFLPAEIMAWCCGA